MGPGWNVILSLWDSDVQNVLAPASEITNIMIRLVNLYNLYMLYPMHLRDRLSCFCVFLPVNLVNVMDDVMYSPNNRLNTETMVSSLSR